MQNYELRTYATEQGTQPFHDWLSDLRDLRAKAKIDLRLARVSLGNFGDSKPLHEGVHELKIDVGHGATAFITAVMVSRWFFFSALVISPAKVKILRLTLIIGKTLNGDKQHERIRQL
jgi:putative component of toxin-antitoxin plasmid stabilization module